MPDTVTSSGVRAEHVVVPLGEPPVARLSVDNGIERVDIRAEPGLPHLLEARFAEPHPVVWVAEHDVHTDYPLGSRLLRRMGRNRIWLNPAVSWSLDVHGGAHELDADVSGLRVRSVNCHAGLAGSRLVLGHPHGTTIVRLASLKQVRIERPAGVPVRLELATGATKVSLDDRFVGAVGRGLADQTPGYSESADRYLVVVAGGADTLTIGSM